MLPTSCTVLHWSDWSKIHYQYQVRYFEERKKRGFTVGLISGSICWAAIGISSPEISRLELQKGKGIC